MNTRSIRYALAALVVLLVLGSFSYPAYSATITGTLDAGVPSVTASSPVPTHIQIPTATVNADIIPVGVTKSGNLDVPPNFYQVGWYKYGPTPDQVGNTVLDGHVDNAGSINGPFKHLVNAKVGDTIYVTMSDGSVATFTVVDSSIYKTTQFPSTSVFRGNSGQSVLKIITCNGTYVPSTGTYDHRLIVTAVRSN